MVNNLAMKKGFTLLELTFVVVICAILLSGVIINGINRLNQAKFKSTLREMNAIAQASIDYYHAHASTWPSDMAVLSNAPDVNYLPRSIDSNPFRSGGYQLSYVNSLVTVSTVIPRGVLIDVNEDGFLSINHLGATDQISMTKAVPNEFSARLNYETKH